MSGRRTIRKKQYSDATALLKLHGTRIRDVLNGLHPHLEFSLDPMISANVAIATYDDIDRYKSYHLRNRVSGLSSQRSDVVKRAAYFTKWITKLRPLMFIRKTSAYPSPDLGLLANESFAIEFAVSLISAELKKDISLTDKMVADLLYDLHHRHLGDDALLSLFQVVVDVAKERIANPKGQPILEFAII
jgi:hypothetical protein